ncbi:hypothetical protein DFH28DRAFT_1085938 [Melampsora americana]|nr:hypothetical protein DFH28DRAFT_1085938 [Melampsora americana]
MKRDREEAPLQEEEIVRIQEEVAGLKASLQALKDKGVLSVQLVYPVLDDLRKDNAGLKSLLQELKAEVSNLNMAIQKVADATGNHHIDIEEECELYDYERHQEYFMTCYQTPGYGATGNQTLRYDAVVNQQVPVSDPHLEL